MTDVIQQLKQLEESGLIRRAQVHPELEYIFRHALMQDAAYASILRQDQKRLHLMVGETLERIYPEQADELAAVLGDHFARAGESEKAIDYYHQAGNRASALSANAEAITHYSRALELLKTRTETAEHIQKELVLQITLGNALLPVKGYAAPEVEQAYLRARELCQRLGDDTPQLFPVLYGLWAYYNVQGVNLQTAYELGEEFLGAAQRQRDLAALLAAHRALGSTLIQMGKFIQAREHFEQSAALHDPRQHRSLAFLYAQDPVVTGASVHASVLSALGYADQALEKAHEARALANSLNHAHSQVFALAYSAFLHQTRREVRVCQEYSEAVIALCTEHGFAYFLSWGQMLQGWAMSEQGQPLEGIAQMHQSQVAIRRSGAAVFQTYVRSTLAAAYNRSGQTDEALAVLSEALAAVEKSGERAWEAELYRMKGETLLSVADATPRAEKHLDAEGYFLKAIEVARQQDARLWELRATVSLARMWQVQDNHKEARQMLTEIYNWFSEGFDTVDLKEAAVLIEELA